MWGLQVSPRAPRVTHSRLWVVITPKFPRLLSAKVLQSGAGKDSTQEGVGQALSENGEGSPILLIWCFKKEKRLDFESSLLVSGLSKH